MIGKITEFIWQCITNQKHSKLMALNHGRRKLPLFNSLGVVGSQLVMEVLL
jgi:hypothetical protein